MTDRAVQDEIIRYLADATARSQSQFPTHVSASEAPKAARFAHFLARRYYRDRLGRSFRYSHGFRKQTRRTAEEVVDRAEFEPFLRECVMGSLQSSRSVGEIARAHLMAAPPPGPWWPELLEYEYCYFLQAATSERASHADRPAPAVSAVCRRFEWALPKVLPFLRAGEPVDDRFRHEVLLLFSRTTTARICVVEVEEALASVFRATNAVHSVGEIAELSGMSIEEARHGLEALRGIGAVQGPDN